jgi:hypothetical protein
MNVSWSVVPSINQNGIVTTYQITYAPLESYHDQTPQLTNTSQLSIDLRDLDEFANYTIQVLAYTAVGPGPSSDQLYVRTDEAGE